MAGRPPNILVTGTPGTGKTTTCQLIAEATGLQHVNVGERVKLEELHSGCDQEFDSLIIDEDKGLCKVCDALEDEMTCGGNVVDHHGCDFFPERWFDLVIVLQCENSFLYDRLAKRDYTERKLTENIECEIMHVVVEEAYESYRKEIVQILPSNTVEEMESNVERTVQWVRQYQASNNTPAS